MTASGGSNSLQLHLGDLDARVLVVQQPLQQRKGLVGDLLALVRHRRLDRRSADDVAQSALCGDSDGEFGVVDPEKELAWIADLPEHGAVRLDDILVASQHLPAAVGLSTPGRARGAGAELDLVDIRYFGQQRGVDRIRHMHMEARIGRVDPFAETQDDALLVRLDTIKRCREPGDDDDADERSRAAPAQSGNAENIAEARLDDAP